MCDTDRMKKKSKQTKARVIQNTLDYVVEFVKRPKNLSLISGSKGKGCYVTEYPKRGKAPSGEIFAHSRLLAINSMNVEKQQFDKIMVQLNTASLPVRLKLQSPPIPVAQKSERVKRRKRRKQRSSERPLRSVTKEKREPQWRNERNLRLSSRETRETRRKFEKNTRRRMSTGQFMKFKNAQPSRDILPPLSIIPPKVLLQDDQKDTSVELKEELAYLRLSLGRIYAALVLPPRNEGEGDQEVVLPFNAKFTKHFRMLEVVLKATRLGRAQGIDDPPSKPAAPAPRYEKDFIPQKSDLAAAANVDQWLGRIIQELGVNHLNLESRAEECIQSLQAICKLKETTDIMGNQVKSLEELLDFVNKKNETAMQQIEEFKSKIINVEQGVEKLVLKICGLRDRVGSLAKCITKVQEPRVNRLASELRLAPIPANFTGDSISNLIMIRQLDPLTAVLDQMVNLVRKTEIVIREGLLVEREKTLTIYDSLKSQQGLSINGQNTIRVM